MSSEQLAHHMKVDGPSTLQLLNAALLEQWRQRLACGFKAVDPHSRESRDFFNRHQANRRLIARAWLADFRARRRERLRRSMKLITGGLP